VVEEKFMALTNPHMLNTEKHVSSTLN